MKTSKARRIVRGYRIKAFPEKTVDRAISRVTYAAISADYREYERRKREIAEMGLEPAEYEKRIQQLTDEMGV